MADDRLDPHPWTPHLEALSKAALTPMPPPEYIPPWEILCADCGHPQLEHVSTAGASFNLHPIRYGRCRRDGCRCTTYAPTMSETQTPHPDPEQPDERHEPPPELEPDQDDQPEQQPDPSEPGEREKN